jgi:alkylation response protein AidB-like acyl-CoA dehydrogenase
MDFSWTNEQLELKRTIIDFVRRELNGGARESDRLGAFSRERWNKACAFGLLGLNVPREFGGQGYSALTTTLALESLGYGCDDNGFAFAVSGQITSVIPTLVRFANDEQRQRLLPRLCNGQSIGCYAMTEEKSGSDAYNLQTTATQRDDGYVLDGEKWFVTFGPVADFALVYVTTNPKAGSWGVSLFIVDLKSSGVEVSPVQEKMGLRSVPIGKLKFNDVFVPRENLVGKEGSGASIFNSSQEWERACILASQIGAMERQLDECVQFARERQAFGQPISKFQAISNRIAEMKLRLETARLLTYKAAWAKDNGTPAMLDAALANLHLGETFLQNSIDAIRIHGGRGYLSEFEIERDLRDAMGAPIYGGTADIQRNIIARLLGL